MARGIFECLESERSVGVGNMGGFPTRAQQHADGHFLLPKRHGLAKGVDVESFDGTEMSGGGQPVRSRAENCYIVSSHYLLLVFTPEIDFPKLESGSSQLTASEPRNVARK